VDDLAKWKVHGPVASLKTESATWDLNQQYWEPVKHFTVASFRSDGTISSSDSYNSDGSIAHSKWLYDPSGRLMEYNSWMNDEPAHRTLYLYDEAGRHVRTVGVSHEGSETDAEVCSYDAEGRRTKVSLLSFRAGNVSYSIEGTDMGLGAPGATKMVTTYDHNDLPVKVVFEDADENPLRQVILKRDTAGKLSNLEIHMGGQSIFGHRDQPVSPEGEMAASLIMQSLGGIFSNTAFSYDSQGRLLERTNSMFNLGGDRTTYRYGDGDDPIEETTEHWSREANLEDDGTLRYGPNKVTAQDVHLEYRYDAHVNWIEKTVSMRYQANAEFQPSNIERRAITYH
jgi:YD repeat-containing protein